MVPIPRWCVALTTLLLLATGCNNGKVRQLSAELAENNKEIDALRAERSQLQEQCTRLQSEAVDLQSEVENLKVKNSELAEWSQQVAARFGPGIWFFGEDERPLPYKSIQNGSPQRLVRELNALFKQSKLPQAVLQKIEKDTAFIHIGDDWQLTQEMGTTGATAYLQAVTYTLTSVPTIDSVEFDFHAGDHAMPGRYTR
ncbi:MAG: hypothetical protein WAU91_05475 [Desulfatitalea sp.]